MSDNGLIIDEAEHGYRRSLPALTASSCCLKGAT